MREIATSWEAFGAGLIMIGRQGENLVTQINIDCATPLFDYPYAAFALRVQNAEGLIYPPARSYMKGDTLVWEITDSDTAVQGDGWAQVIMYGGEGEIGKSAKGVVRVLEALQGGGDTPPEPVQEWLDEAQKTLEELKQAGIAFETDETLTLKNGVLSVNTSDEPEQDNTLPITSAAVFTTVGNINALLETI